MVIKLFEAGVHERVHIDGIANYLNCLSVNPQKIYFVPPSKIPQLDRLDIDLVLAVSV